MTNERPRPVLIHLEDCADGSITNVTMDGGDTAIELAGHNRDIQISGVRATNTRRAISVTGILDGGAIADVQHRSIKIGRNERCPCESGKKYKKCCGA